MVGLIILFTIFIGVTLLGAGLVISGVIVSRWP